MARKIETMKMEYKKKKENLVKQMTEYNSIKIKQQQQQQQQQ